MPPSCQDGDRSRWHHTIVRRCAAPRGVSADKALAEFDQLGLDDTAAGLYLHGHAERIFGLGEAKAG